MPFEAREVPGYIPGNYIITDLYNNYFFDVVKEKSDRAPAIWDIIAQVNGKSVTTKDNLLELFQEKEEVELLLIRKVEGEYRGWNCTIRPKNNTHGYGDLISGINRSAQWITNPPKEIRVFAEEGLDFYDYITYDILITGNDPLVDKKILEKFCNSGLFGQMKRDEENPDVIVCVAKSANESISSTYVPPTTSVVNTGSTTRPVYNYLTRTVSFETKQHNRYEHTEGYTKTSTATNIQLEFTVLDAKKMNDPNQKTAPIIWQMNYTRNVTDRNFELIDEYLAVATWNCFPFSQVRQEEEYIFFDLGIRWGSESSDYIEIADVLTGSYAEKLGLKKGDKIIRINGKKTYNEGIKIRYFRPRFYEEYASKEKKFLFYLDDNIDRFYNIRRVYNTIDSRLETPLSDNSTKYTILRGGEKIVLTGSLHPSIEPYNIGAGKKIPICTRIAIR